MIRRLGQFNLYMQDAKDGWSDWQDEYARKKEALEPVALSLGAKAGLSAEESAELSRKYR